MEGRRSQALRRRPRTTFRLDQSSDLFERRKLESERRQREDAAGAATQRRVRGHTQPTLPAEASTSRKHHTPDQTPDSWSIATVTAPTATERKKRRGKLHLNSKRKEQANTR